MLKINIKKERVHYILSRQRKIFSANLKLYLVLELLRAEKNLHTLAIENNIQTETRIFLTIVL